MNKEDFIKAIENVPKIDSINPISAYNSINVEDLANAVDRFKKVPTYDELLKENQKYKEVIDKVKELIIDNIEETTYEYIGSNKIKVLQKLIMNNDGVNELLDILKEVE